MRDGANGMKREMYVLICGDRHWSDHAMIEAELSTLAEGSIIIQGGAPGADDIADTVARALSLGSISYRADWDRYGRRAGPIRNREMLDTNPQEVWAFHDDIEHSKGTRDCVKEAKRRGIPVRVFSHAKEPVS